MHIQGLCKARIRSFLMTDMILTISPAVKSQTCSIILRVGDWGGHCMVDMSCCSNHVTVRHVVWAGALSCLITNGWFRLPNMFCVESRQFSDNVWHNFVHSRFYREWSDCHHFGSQCPPPPPLQKRFDFYWPCIDIRVYLPPGYSSYHHLPVTICKVEP